MALNIDPQYADSIYSAMGKASSTGANNGAGNGADMNNVMGGIASGSAFLSQVGDIYQTYKSDPSKYFNETYSRGQNPQGFSWQESPYNTSGWQIGENMMEGAGKGMQMGGPWGALVGGILGTGTGIASVFANRSKQEEFEQEQQKAYDRYNKALSDYDIYNAQGQRQMAQQDYMNRLRNSVYPEYGGSVYQYMM